MPANTSSTTSGNVTIGTSALRACRRKIRMTSTTIPISSPSARNSVCSTRPVSSERS